MIFRDPWFLLLLPVVAAVLLYQLRRRASRAVLFSSTAQAATLKRTWRIRLRWIPPVLRAVALTTLVVALARPMEGNEKTRLFSEGIAIEMLIDHSGSMQAMDFQLDGQHVDRLTAVKDVVRRFVSGDEELELTGRPADLIGMVTFARYADNACPLTLDHDYLLARLGDTRIVTRRDEDGTAIGDAIGLATERLRALKTKDDGRDEIESKVLILLTDGENNAGDLDPLAAAELARSLNMRIYTIGVGTTGRAPIPATDPFTGRRTLRRINVKIDEKTLKEIARITGGEYFRATDTESLAAIYATIDQLETTRIEQQRYGDYRELAVRPARLGGMTLPPLLLLALLALAGEVLLSRTVWRAVP
jgi:Ca-activated chloride channel homolog